MKTRTSIKLFLPCMTLLASALAQAAEGDPATKTWSGDVTPKLFLFDFYDGVGTNRTHFLERYAVQEGWGGDTRSGGYLDLDLDLAYSDGVKDVFTFERRGDGKHNHDGRARYNVDNFGVSGHYSHYRSATGGIDYLYNPNLVPGGVDPAYTGGGSGYLAVFNDDANQFLYHVDRTTYGAAIKLKPELLGAGTSLAVNYDGYQRDGNKFATWVAGGGDFAGGNPQLERWRGYNKPIDENMNRVSLNFTASPRDLFQFAYDGRLEKFDNTAKDFTIADFATGILPNTISGTNGTKPLHFIPDSTLMNHAIRISRSFGDTAVAAGYGMSVLEQDSFTQRQIDASYTTGKISSDNAFLNLNHRFSPTLGMEGYVKYYSRDNDSTFPAVGLISDTANQQLGVRINKIESLNYGLAATLRRMPLKSTLTAGWKREDTDRDFTWTDVTVTNGIQPQRSLYREQTLSDEIYLKWVARPMDGVTVRVTPSYLWADKTGLVTEPEESLNLKTRVSYVAPSGMMVNGYYNYRNKKNSNNTFTDALGGGVDGASYAQDIDNTVNSAGVSINLAPAERITVSAGLDWTQNDLEAVYFTTNNRRFEAPAASVLFAIRDPASNYNVDSYSLTLGGDWQVRDNLKLNAGYTFSMSKGDIASGEIAAELATTIDGRIDSTLHSFTLGADYVIKDGVTLRAKYINDNYEDGVYRALDGSTLDGGVNTLVVGVSFAL